MSKSEKDEVVANCEQLNKLKFSRSLPYTFTEHRSLMAASVLNSKRASEVGVFIIRAFVKIRKMVSQNIELSERLNALEQKLSNMIHNYFK